MIETIIDTGIRTLLTGVLLDKFYHFFVAVFPGSQLATICFKRGETPFG